MVGIFPNDAAAIRLVGTTERQIIVAAEIAAAERELEEAGVTERPGVVLADAGYWSNGHIDALRERGMTPIVAPDAHNRDGPRKTRLGGPYDFMRRVLATDHGAELYSRRQWMVNRRIERFKRMEPVFAQIKANSERAAARPLLKLHRHSLATAAA